jgi:hypothetical protein
VESVLAFLVGYVLGGDGGRRDRRNVTRSFGAIKDSEEVAAVVHLARAQVGRSLRDIADMVDGTGRAVPSEPDAQAAPDLVDRVRLLIQQ